MSNKDGIRIPDDFLAINAERLKRIPPSAKSGRVIPIWVRVAAAAAVFAGALWLIPTGTPNEELQMATLSSDDLVKLYDQGLIDIDENELYPYTDMEELETTLELYQDDWDELLIEIEEDELYNYLEG